MGPASPDIRCSHATNKKGKDCPMSENRKMNSKGKQVAVVVGATSKWQSNGRNTLLAHGQTLDDSGLSTRVARSTYYALADASCPELTGQRFQRARIAPRRDSHQHLLDCPLLQWIAGTPCAPARQTQLAAIDAAGPRPLNFNPPPAQAQ
jgi:hypothetical protein